MNLKLLLVFVCIICLGRSFPYKKRSLSLMGYKPCHTNPCAHDGVCKSNGDTYVCECVGDYIGDTCDVLNPCHNNPCGYGACEYMLKGNNYVHKCTCPGVHSETDCNGTIPSRASRATFPRGITKNTSKISRTFLSRVRGTTFFRVGGTPLG